MSRGTILNNKKGEILGVLFHELSLFNHLALHRLPWHPSLCTINTQINTALLTRIEGFKSIFIYKFAFPTTASIFIDLNWNVNVPLRCKGNKVQVEETRDLILAT